MAFFDDLQDDSKLSSSETSSTNDDSKDISSKDKPPHDKNYLGEAPEFPPISFSYDDKEGKLFVLNRRGKIVQEISVMALKGDKGDSAFEQWKKENKLDDKTPFPVFLETLKGKDGEDAGEWTINDDGLWCYRGKPTEYRAVGKDGSTGKSAYEDWAENQPAEMRTPEIWRDSQKGKDGETGRSAFEDWKSLLPEERKDATLSDFFSWLVKQTEEKIDAKEGATWVPNIVDGKLVFQNNRTESVSDPYPIHGKDGKSFIPKIVDEKLTFVDENGNEIMPRHDYRGKSAFELWQEQQGNEGKTLDDFFDFLKGEKGDPGLDGIVREAKHSYLDIKDHRCPVQKIDTELLVNCSDSGKTPETIINEKIKEIDEKRKEGECYKKKSLIRSILNLFKSSKNDDKQNEKERSRFKEFFWWCAGADRALLRMCPGDHSKYVGIGSVILFTALMAWFSSFIAMQLVFKPLNIWGGIPLWAGLFATFWGLMIFFLDRFITNTMYSDGNVTISKDEFVGGLPRILIAIILGIVISAPLELKIFDDEIKEYIVSNKIESDERYKTAKSQLDGLIENKEKSLEDFRNTNLLDRDSDAFKTKKDTTITTEQRSNTTTKVDSNGIKTTEENYKERPSRKIKSVFNNEDYSKHVQKVDSLCKIEEKTLDDSINLRTNRLHVLKDEIKNEIDSVYGNTVGLYAQLDALHELAMAGYKPLFDDDEVLWAKSNKNDNDEASIKADSNKIANTSKKVNNEVSIKVDSIDTANVNTIEQKENLYSCIIYKKSVAKFLFSLVLVVVFLLLLGFETKSKCKDDDYIKRNVLKCCFALLGGVLIGCNYEVFHRLIYYLFTPIGLIMLLFVLIDISPVLYKMMLADGVYDKYLQQEKLLKQDKIRLSLARMVRKIEKGELKKLSPFIMGDVYGKMGKKSKVKNEDKIDWKDNEANSSLGSGLESLDKMVEDENEKLFKIVLEYKKRIILASYSAWYRDMRDALIGSPDDSEGKKISAEEVLLNNPTFDNPTSEMENHNNNASDDDSEKTSEDKQDPLINSSEELEKD